MAAEETTLRKFLFGAIIFGALITGTFTMIGLSLPDDAATANYGVYNRTFNKFETLRSNADQMSESMNNPNPDSGVFGTIMGLVKAVYQPIQMVWTSVATMGSVFLALPVLGIPNFVGYLVYTLIGITVAFAIITLYMNRTA